jgi:signal transduction histidine kinase
MQQLDRLDGFDGVGGLGADTAPASGSLPWFETIATCELDSQARSHSRTARRTGTESELRSTAHSLAGLVHDARNMVAAMDLYCDLLEEPGVLSAPFHHYASELRLVGRASRALLEKLAIAENLRNIETASRGHNLSAVTTRLSRDSREPVEPLPESIFSRSSRTGGVSASSPRTLARSNYSRSFHLGKTVENLADELLANQNLLAALVGPAITLGLTFKGGQQPIAMAADDLTRVLVNLVRNAAEAMHGGGHIQIALEEGHDYLSLSFTDNGPGILQEALEAIFSPGYSTHVVLDPDSSPDFSSDPEAGSCAWPTQHRGLGLSIVRSLVVSAGGSIWAANRKADPADLHNSIAARGAVFTIEFPLFPIAT